MEPQELRTVYRQLLRYAAASVRHSKPATRSLRRLLRPHLDAFGTGQLGPQAAAYDASALRARVQNTVNLLAASAQSSSVERRQINNLVFLEYTQRPPLHSVLATYARDPDTNLSKTGKVAHAELTAAAEQELSKLVRLAEAEQEVWLGRLPRGSRT